jgi:hypothetical protein
LVERTLEKRPKAKLVGPDVSGVDSFLGKNWDRRFFKLFFGNKGAPQTVSLISFSKEPEPKGGGSLNLKHGCFFQKTGNL